MYKNCLTGSKARRVCSALAFLVAVICCAALPFQHLRPLGGVHANASENPVPEQERNDGIIDTSSQAYTELFAELVNEHGFAQSELNELFADIAIENEALALINSQVESPPYLKYLAILATPAIIKAGKEKLEEYRELLDEIEARFGVDREYLIAIWGIETRFGQQRGKHEVFRTLNTLFTEYPRRSAFFRRELIHFLLLCREHDIAPRSVMGSYAGAFGQPQFMPSSFREYAVSFDDNDHPDIFHSIPDILASIANYLHRHNWQLGAPVIANIGDELKSENLERARQAGRRGFVPLQEVEETQGLELTASPGGRPLVIVEFQPNPFLVNKPMYFAGYPNFQAITAWNHSNRYAMIVTHLARAIAGDF